MAMISVLGEILRRPTLGAIVEEMIRLMGPIWVAVIIGVLVGWAWKPKWAKHLGKEQLDCLKMCSSPETPLSSCVSSLGLANLCPLKFQQTTSVASDSRDVQAVVEASTFSSSSSSECSSTQVEGEFTNSITNDDLDHLFKLVEVKDGGPAWIQMMDRSTPTMSYQAWRRDPETGPPQYRSRTVFEDSTPELTRDFFWDDEFRKKWDDMHISAETLEEYPSTGTMAVHWVRKFPFFCSDREYVIGRRIWESKRSYYCVTKGVPCSSVPRRNKPRRVDLYYSSWCIRAVESSRGNGQLTACEVLLFHHEDMGIPWEIAKLGVRQGMWGAVKKIEPGLRAYQKERASGSPISRCAFMAQVNTKFSADYLRSLENNTSCSSKAEQQDSSKKQSRRNNIPKFLIIGGAVVLACTLDRGLVTKAIIFGVARKFSRIGR
ncbi:hypothetical protein MLD38_016629 [Melastoma candidum]|uniref:Uncharacterized protein n=1 Tax=Melastoma candidum TaxID=119954 RepID=A0ACB9QR52_9MYRT|nr:hypothetical protein MLD38_016629 [Melastoma candidum]